MHVVFDFMHSPCLVRESAPVPGRDSVGMEVCNEDISTGRANAAYLPIGGERIWQMPQHESTPHHIKTIRGEGHGSYVTGYHVARPACGKHIRAQIHTNGPRNVCDAAPYAATCVEQSCMR